MPYIGNQPSESFTSFATQEFSTSATTSYTLDHAVTNENEIALFVNNVRQQPGSGKAYTASGTALTLSAATASTDTMYCVFLGRALQTVTPATNSITAAMVGNDLISGKDALTSAPASTDELLISDGGVLKRIDVSLIGGIQMADQWRLSSTVSVGNSSETTLTGWERPDDTESSLSTYGRIGTGMSESSGTFTFPSTGIYLVRFIYGGQTGVESATYGRIYMSKDGSNYDLVSSADQYMSGGFNGKATAEYLADVTNTSNDLMQFRARVSSGTGQFQGNTDQNITSVTFIRLGDT